MATESGGAKGTSYIVFLPPAASVIKGDIAAGLHKRPRKERLEAWRAAAKRCKTEHSVQCEVLAVASGPAADVEDAAVASVSLHTDGDDSTASASQHVQRSWPGASRPASFKTPSTYDPFAITPSTGNPSRVRTTVLRGQHSPSLAAAATRSGISDLQALKGASLGASTDADSGYSVVPTHSLHFDEHGTLSIRDVLANPTPFLPMGYAEATARDGAPLGGHRFGTLALVRDVGALTRWKGKHGTETCEATLMDSDLSCMTLLLRGSYAEQWGGEDAFDYDSSGYSRGLHSAAQQETFGFLETIAPDAPPRRPKPKPAASDGDGAVPLRAGDVVAFAGLSLSYRTVKDATGQPRKMLCAVADPQRYNRVSSELCWRSDVRSRRDAKYTFDPDLALISSKHRRVCQLASVWQTLRAASQTVQDSAATQTDL